MELALWGLSTQKFIIRADPVEMHELKFVSKFIDSLAKKTQQTNK